MHKTSLDKGKIKVLLLEGVHPSCVAALEADGYSHIEARKKSLSGDRLIEGISDAYIGGIRSATPISVPLLGHDPALRAPRCFLFGPHHGQRNGILELVLSLPEPSEVRADHHVEQLVP